MVMLTNYSEKVGVAMQIKLIFMVRSKLAWLWVVVVLGFWDWEGIERDNVCDARLRH